MIPGNVAVMDGPESVVGVETRGVDLGSNNNTILGEGTKLKRIEVIIETSHSDWNLGKVVQVGEFGMVVSRKYRVLLEIHLSYKC